MVKGVVYSTAGTRRAVVALDAATGELIWMHSEREGARGEAAPRQLSGRGLSYWTDGKEERILYVTPGYRLVALDARTGVPVQSFGRNGIVDLKQENDQTIDLVVHFRARRAALFNTATTYRIHGPMNQPTVDFSKTGFVARTIANLVLKPLDALGVLLPLVSDDGGDPTNPCLSTEG